MPTPAGKARVGDKLRHKSTGVVCEVVKREGNDALYSLILRPLETKLPRNVPRAIGYPDCFRLLEASYWIGRTYEFVEGG